MASPLKLKRQITTNSKNITAEVATELPIAAVLVDTPVSHLEGIYDYLVPVHLSDLAIIGSKVLVEFGKSKTEALIIDRKSNSDKKQGIKQLLDVISPPGLINQDVMKHIEMVRDRFGGGIWSILKSAVPARVVKEEKLLEQVIKPAVVAPYESESLREIIGNSDYAQLRSNKRIRWGSNFPSATDADHFLVELVKIRAQANQVLLLLPDESDISRFMPLLAEHFGDLVIELGSHLSKGVRYRNYLKANLQSPKVIIATRSGAFTALGEDATVIVVSDLDQSHYELHAPGWNTRDVTLLRDSKTSVIFISPSHSLEIARLIEIGWLDKKVYKVKTNQKYITGESGNSYILAIKNGSSKGNVLVSVAEKGYANLFLCATCRNTATCECGGKLQIDSVKKIPKCYLCEKIYKEFKCSYCSGNRPFVIAKGIDRTAEEIGRAISSASILISSGSKKIQSLPPGKHVVLATAGSEPSGVYSAVVMLDGERIFNRPSLRAEELAKFHWFSLLARASFDAQVFFSLPNHHPVVQALIRADSSTAATYELESRKQSKLPPYYRVAVVIGDSAEISKFAENLRNTKNYEITGPVSVDSYQSKLLIRVGLPEAQLLVDLLDDITKVQGVKGRKIFKVRFDPFDL